MKALAYLNRYLWRYRWLLGLGVLSITLSNVFQVFVPQVVRQAIDYIIHNIRVSRLFTGVPLENTLSDRLIATLVLFGLLLLGLALMRGLFLFFTRQTIIAGSRHIEYDLKDAIYKHYQSLPLSFYRRHSTGDLMNRIGEDVGHVRMYLGPAIMYGLNMVVLFAIAIPYMFSVNVELSLYVLAPLPILSLSIYFVSARINRQSERIQAAQSDLSTNVQEGFSGIRILKAFVREKDSARRFSDKAEEYQHRSMRLVRTEALFHPLILCLIGLSTILAAYIGGRKVIEGSITVGNIAEFILYVNLLTWPVTSLGWITSLVQRASASQERINEFLRERSDIVSEKNLTPPVQGAITFENVSLVYPDSGIEAIRNLSFQVKQGETVAIVGGTGAGKSTICSLVPRLYDPTGGRILLDGVDLKDYEPGYLRAQMGVVPQDVFLFSETIRRNIAFGRDEATEEQIIQAAKDAGVWDNILDLPQGLDTLVGERGVTLSGGQKQRVSLARALLLDPQILILDDALSAVDTKTEDEILGNLDRLMTGRTALIISHRVSSVKLADRILVLDDGALAEAGTHEELMALGGIYRALHDKQLEKEAA